jgi:hypothetical protein
MTKNDLFQIEEQFVNDTNKRRITHGLPLVTVIAE